MTKSAGSLCRRIPGQLPCSANDSCVFPETLTMLDFGSFKARSCGGSSRRSFIRTAAAAPFALSAGLPSLEALAAAKERAKAKSVILLWLWGGPSHIDLCDPNPDAPMDFRGPFGTINTKTPGMRFTELLPRMAARSDRYSVVRSMVNSNNGHPGAGTVGVTGFEESSGPVQPNFGSIVARHRGQTGSLPPFFYVGKGIPRDLPRRIEGYGGGTLAVFRQYCFWPGCSPHRVSSSRNRSISRRSNGSTFIRSPLRSLDRGSPCS
jgi:hypothetical protein